MNPKDKAQLKYKLVLRLMNYTYRHVGERLHKSVMDLLSRNNAMHEENRYSFFYVGHKWPKDSVSAATPAHELHETLWDEADELFNWYVPIEQSEVPVIQNMFRKIVNSTDDVEELLSMLPGVLHEAVRDVLEAAELTLPPKPMEEVAAQLGISDKTVRLFSVRMMSNLVGA